MKTIGDLERWLRADDSRTAFINIERGKMTVDLVSNKGCVQVNMQSSTLEGAFENAMDELRRKANGIQSTREPKPQPESSTTSTLPPQKPPFQASPSISQAAQQAYQQQAAKAACANCSGRGFVTSGGFLFLCPACNP